jgi:signal transduction histidine kinase
VRARLLGIVISLVLIVAVGLGLPLAWTLARSANQVLFQDRLEDAARFASVAQGLLPTNNLIPLSQQVARYESVYQVQVAVFDVNGDPLISNTDHVDPGSAVVQPAVANALAGRTPAQPQMVVPWSSAPYVLAEPVLESGEVHGVVVLELGPNSYAGTRAAIRFYWELVLGGAVLALVLALAGALPIVRWVLRPVGELDRATERLIADVVDGQSVHPIAGGTGPPELRQLTHAFNRMAVEVGQVLEAQRQFVSEASHQLRGPLNVLGLRLNVLKKTGSAAEAAEHHQAAKEQYDRLRQLINDLLDMGSVGQRGEPVPVDVDEAVRIGVERAAEVGARRHVTIQRSGSGGRALAPPGGLDTILEALLDNAVKYTAAHSAIEVEAGQQTRTDGEWVVLSVRDRGSGLRQDELERAVQPFWRSTAHVNAPGSGLGLTIVDRLVRQVTGRLRLELPSGGGLRVVVELPVAK